MRIVALTAVCSALALAAGACAEQDPEDDVAYTESETGTTMADADTAGMAAPTAESADTTTTATTTGAGTSTTWPTGSRIVVEDGVTYRIDPGGTRIRLGPNDARIVVEDGVRYRVGPGGTRVRIDESGAAIDVDADGVEADIDLD
jgi:hypothetical protein